MLLAFGADPPGKGGVGKTTAAAAFALWAAESGRRVLLVSTDPAHSTGDIFARPIGPEERLILPNLTALEIGRYSTSATIFLGIFHTPIPFHA